MDNQHVEDIVKCPECGSRSLTTMRHAVKLSVMTVVSYWKTTSSTREQNGEYSLQNKEIKELVLVHQ